MSLAVNFHPHDVAFLLIDYKGGEWPTSSRICLTAWDHHQLGWRPVHAGPSLYQCGDPSSGTPLWSIWVNHINQYQKKFKLGEATEPLPHLFLISDEFAELKVNQPDFIKELVSIARRAFPRGALDPCDAKTFWGR